jgi:hypothetical protein
LQIRGNSGEVKWLITHTFNIQNPSRTVQEKTGVVALAHTSQVIAGFSGTFKDCKKPKCVILEEPSWRKRILRSNLSAFLLIDY